MYRNLFLAAVVCAGCELGTGDDQFGASEAPLASANGGAPTCNSPKVLICHIPPGNPANMHSICIGQPAVKPHQQHHGDPLGACGPGGGQPGTGGGSSGGTGGGSGGSGGSGGGSGPHCAQQGSSCSADADCCLGGACSQGTCIPIIN